MKEQSRKIALCGVSCALAVTLLLLGGILPLATFCAPMLAMTVLLPVRQECGTRMASAAYGAAAILALLLVADREAALIFVFFGWYPLVQPRILALRSRLLRLVAKLLFCNLAIALVYGILLFLFQLGDLAGETPLMVLLLVVMSNVLFLLLDRMLSRMALLWQRKLRRKFFPHT